MHSPLIEKQPYYKTYPLLCVSWESDTNKNYTGYEVTNIEENQQSKIKKKYKHQYEQKLG